MWVTFEVLFDIQNDIWTTSHLDLHFIKLNMFYSDYLKYLLLLYEEITHNKEKNISNGPITEKEKIVNYLVNNQ